MAEIIYIISSLLIFPAIIFAAVAQGKVSRAFQKYGSVPAYRGITAAKLAERLLAENGCAHVRVERTHGHLTDHYDPRKRVVRLSESVADSTSLAALGIAAHEVGHAIQHQTKYAPLIIRRIVIRTSSIVSKTLPLLIIGGLIGSLVAGGLMMGSMQGTDFFLYIMIAACAVYGLSFLANLITLPTEYNASRRAQRLLWDGNLLYNDDEKQAVAKVLNAAALTYVAALLISLLYFMRFLALVLMMRGRRR